ncbi:FtsB family cell division protein [Membranihabitans marinus]|uniref:FtsB family cell division protein n=1 Tax=Membranihabitans marinus TaxID=1227546 RepID=UPI001F3953DA|nr:septum formation initiator family protein [Membranihabitans marinus]
MIRKLYSGFLDLIDKIPPVLINKYILAILAFGVWMLFFDKNRLLIQWELSQEISQLEQDQKYYEEEIERAKEARDDLNSNLEKYAREKYFLKQSDEDVFIIEKN